MSGPLDPYHRWLGISPKDQPPNHYRLLGIDLFESDPEVIRDAAERQTAHVRTYQLGAHAAVSQKILNEVAAAKACLLDHASKASYDAALRQKAHAHASPVDAGIDLKAIGMADEQPHSGARPRAVGRRRSPQSTAGLAGGIAILLIATVSVALLMRSTTRPPHGIETSTATSDTSSQAGRRAGTEPLAQHVTTGTRTPASGNVAKPEIAVEQLPSGVTAGPTPPAPTLQPKSPAPTPKAADAKVESLAEPPPKGEAFAPGKEPEESVDATTDSTDSKQVVNSLGMQFVLIPPGEFDMGSTPEEIAWVVGEGKRRNDNHWYFNKALPNEAPLHRIPITVPFYMARHEVTQGEYQRLMGVNPSSFSPQGLDAGAVAGEGTERYPVDSVSWANANEFCSRLSSLPEEREAKRTYRLPTEAEWEYACRAGSKGMWYFGDDLSEIVDHAWVEENAASRTHPVGRKKANAIGLHDMYGNVQEWCADWNNFRSYAQAAPSASPKVPFDAGRVLRGGGWNIPGYLCRSAYRIGGNPMTGQKTQGFRVVLTLAEERPAVAAAESDLNKPPAKAVEPPGQPEQAKPRRSSKSTSNDNVTQDRRNQKPAGAAKLPGKVIPETIEDELRLPRIGEPYKLMGPITIGSTGSLYLERGATVLCAVGAKIVVEGKIGSYGDTEDFVKFRPATPYGWDTILVPKGKQQSIERFDVRGAAIGLHLCGNGPQHVQDCIFMQNKIGVKVETGGGPSFKNCIVANNLGDGVLLHGHGVALDHCTIASNGGVGLHMTYYGSPTVSASEIRANRIGIKSTIYETKPVITSSNIVGNQVTAEVKTNENFTCQGNYWGTDQARIIAGSMIDGRRQSGGLVIFEPFEKRPIKDAGSSLKIPKERRGGR